MFLSASRPLCFMERWIIHVTHTSRVTKAFLAGSIFALAVEDSQYPLSEIDILKDSRVFRGQNSLPVFSLETSDSLSSDIIIFRGFATLFPGLRGRQKGKKPQFSSFEIDISKNFNRFPGYDTLPKSSPGQALPSLHIP